MQLPELLALSLASALASGLNVYASVLLLGLLQRYQVIQLPGAMATLGHDWVLIAAGVLYCIEFIADKIPVFDSFWDAIHTFIRIPIGAALSAGMFNQFEPHWQWIMAMAGGFLAFQSHGTKASVRLTANTSPEPFSNWALSLVEDALAFGLVWLAAQHPYLAIALAGAIAVGLFFLLRMIFRAIGKLWQRLFGPRTEQSVQT
jgi:hypothetical protein